MVYFRAMGQHRWRILALSLLVAGCSSEPSFGNHQADNVREGPEYGDLVPIRGKAVFAFEKSAVVLCPETRQNCTAPVHDDGTDDMSRYCWLKFTDSARADSERLSKSGGQFEGPEEYWMEGNGRIALKPGAFGHLAQYRCEVEMTNIAKFEVGPPWFFAPPPQRLGNAR